MAGKFATAFEGQYRYLIEKLVAVLDTGLLTELHSKRVISNWQLGTIANKQANPAPENQVECLLDILRRCDDSDFDIFIDILKELKQTEVVTELEIKLKDPKAFNAANKPSGTGANRNQDVKEPDYMDDDFDVSVRDLKTTSDEFYQKHYKQAFPMTSKLCGTALIIDIFRTTGKTDRVGTLADRESLVKLFRKLHLNVEVYSDVNDDGVDVTTDEVKPTAQNIPKFIKRTLEDMESTEQCFILVTLSHGGINNDGQEVIYGCDGEEVTKKEMLDTIDQTTTDTALSNIPRLVIFQCCRVRPETGNSDARHNTIYCNSCTGENVSDRRQANTFYSRFCRHFHQTRPRHRCPGSYGNGQGSSESG